MSVHTLLSKARESVVRPGASAENLGAQQTTVRVLLPAYLRVSHNISTHLPSPPVHRRCQRVLRVWSPRWEVVAKGYCILDLRSQPDFYDYHQPVGFACKYHKVVACELDGTVTKHDKSRVHSCKARCSYNDKVKHQAGQGLTWTTAIGTFACAPAPRSEFMCVVCALLVGLVLLCTTMWCGRTSEKALVRLYRHWLSIFPKYVCRE